jgi:glycosyltransferase involved in cell wall biosynthesis
MDVHVHSKHSMGSSQWLLYKLNCPESFSEPKCIYNRAKNRGMDLVTITDHNSLAGSLDIAHLDDAFLSEEITAKFPTDGCKIHILALDISEEQHREIQKLRGNIYELVRYLRAQSIFHAAAHPLYDINHLLTWEHVEQLLLLFRTFELNGARENSQNTVLQTILDELDPAVMERLANKHDLAPQHPEPWKKNLIGGSDDHSSLNIARLHTLAPGAGDKDEFLRLVFSGQGRVLGTPATPGTMAHNLYGIGYQFYKDKLGLNKMMGKDAFTQHIDAILTGGTPGGMSLKSRILSRVCGRRILRRVLGRVGDSWMESVFLEARNSVIRNLKQDRRTRWSDSSETEKEWYHLVREISEKVGSRFADSVVSDLSEARFAGIFQSLGSAGTVSTLLAPYFMAYSMFGKDREFGRFCLRRFREEKSGVREPAPARLAVFTDTFHEMNGIATTLRQQLRAARAENMPYFVLTCGHQTKPEENGVINFPSQGTFQLPEYPEQELHYPPFFQILDSCYRQEITHILSSTPGPMGLTALGVAKVLQIPLQATYHTALPEYVRERTGDRDMEEIMWKYILWYYKQMDTVFVPSDTIARQLIQKGLDRARVRTLPHGTDTEAFHPSKRNGFWAKYFDSRPEVRKLLYVGRVAREKDLHILTAAYKECLRHRDDLKLIIVGSGPYLDQMQSELAGYNVCFSGELSGDDLAQAYASSDIFVFPSATDTFGKAVLEAQASGLPVIVSDEGGPREVMRSNETGLVFRARQTHALASAILSLAERPGLIRRMGEQARASCRDRSFQAAFREQWSFTTQQSRTC